MRTLARDITITAGGGTQTFKADGLTKSIIVTGADVTLTSGLTLASDVDEIGVTYTIYWKQKVEKGSGSFTFFGKAIDKATVENCLIIAAYNGTDWNVWVIDDVDLSKAVSSPLATADYVQLSDGAGGFTNRTLQEGALKNIFGSDSTATAQYAMAFMKSIASGIYGFAWSEGQALRTHSTAFNFGIGDGDHSLAVGKGSQTHDYGEVVFGEYNITSTGNQSAWVSTDSLFILGCGTGAGARDNAIQILKNGNATFYKNFTVGGIFSRPLNVVEVSTATYALNSVENYDKTILHVTRTTTGACTITLNTSMLAHDTEIVIKDAGLLAGTNNITIQTQGAELIDGLATFVLKSNKDSVTLYNDGSNWFIQ